MEVATVKRTAARLTITPNVICQEGAPGKSVNIIFTLVTSSNKALSVLSKIREELGIIGVVSMLAKLGDTTLWKMPTGNANPEKLINHSIWKILNHRHAAVSPPRKQWDEPKVHGCRHSNGVQVSLMAQMTQFCYHQKPTNLSAITKKKQNHRV